MPIETVKPVDLLIDELVRATLTEGRALAADMRAFKQRSFERVGALQALLAREYGATLGGVKGNVTFPGYDGCGRVQIATQDKLQFGPQLKAAKALVDECLLEWSKDSHVVLRALVDQVFSVVKEGEISHSGIFMLLRMKVDDDLWYRAMETIHDSMSTSSSSTYLRLSERAVPDAPWAAIPLDIARA